VAARHEIRPAEIPEYVPGKVWLEALDRPWTGLSARGYRYGPSEVAHTDDPSRERSQP
jgi:hypothetical protein